MRPVTKEQREEVIYNYSSTKSLRTLSRETGVSKPSVERILAEKGLEPTKGRRGPKKKLSVRKERTISHAFKAKTVKNAADGEKWVKQELDVNVSRQTIRLMLRKYGIKCWKKQKKPKLTPDHIRKRYKFAKVHRKMTYFDFINIVFSDEKKFNLKGSDGQAFTYCTEEDLLKQENIQGMTKFGGGSLMIWGCITSKGVGKLVRTTKKMDSEEYIEVLKEGLFPTYEKYNLSPDRYIFMQDGAACHTSAKTRNWLSTQNISRLDWPPNSPDMNPIENLWSIVEKRLRQQKQDFSDPEKLWEKIQEEWSEIPEEIIKNLYFSMCSRIKALRKAKGGVTEY